MDILDAIGNTSMVRLRKVVPPECADILVKLEWENPSGSVKDRMAQAVIVRAEADGRLKPGGTVVEYTGGSTGTSLALVCAAKGYRIRIVSSDAFSSEARPHGSSKRGAPPVPAKDRGRAACYASIAVAAPRRFAARETYETASNPINATGIKDKAPSPAR
jgi:cysteine synthase